MQVRQLVGYGRLGDPVPAEMLHELYAKEWGWFRNIFCPTMERLRTAVEGGRKKRVYDKPQTLFARLKACSGAAPKQIEVLEKLQSELYPIRLQESIEKKLHGVLEWPKREGKRLAA